MAKRSCDELGICNSATKLCHECSSAGVQKLRSSKPKPFLWPFQLRVPDVLRSAACDNQTAKPASGSNAGGDSARHAAQTRWLYAGAGESSCEQHPDETPLCEEELRVARLNGWRGVRW